MQNKKNKDQLTVEKEKKTEENKRKCRDIKGPLARGSYGPSRQRNIPPTLSSKESFFVL
jgi:hypothetical protein